MTKIHGSYSTSTAYYQIIENVPYLLYEIDGHSAIQHDIDSDGEIETTTNWGTSVFPDYVLYEWDLNNQSIRFVRLTDALNCNRVSYNINDNSFYAADINNGTGEIKAESVYQYADDWLIKADKFNFKHSFT